MNIQEAIKHIVSNWEILHDKQKEKLEECSHPISVAVWCAISGNDDPYAFQVDKEWIGITPEGNIAWAYASGCSCWDGEYDEDRKASVKELTLSHQNITPEKWEEAIIKFAESEKIQYFRD